MEEQVNVTSGVDTVPDAGGQESVSAAPQETASDGFDLEALLFGNDNDTGEDQSDAGSVEEPEQGDSTQDLPEPAEKAFAKKWTAEKEKLEKEVRDKVMSEIEQKTQNTPQQQAQGEPQHRAMSDDELDKLADDLNVSPQAAKILYQQQQYINQLAENERRNTQRSREQTEYSNAKSYVTEMKAQNPSMPDWDDKSIHEYRMKHYKQYGSTLPWKEAYRLQLADAVLSGDVTRQAQQAAIQQIQKRDSATVGIQKPSSQKKTINDLSKDDFNKMVEDAKVGKFTRS